MTAIGILFKYFNHHVLKTKNIRFHVHKCAKSFSTWAQFHTAFNIRSIEQFQLFYIKNGNIGLEYCQSSLDILLVWAAA